MSETEVMSLLEFIAPLITVVVAIGGAWWVQRASGAREITEATKVLIEPMTARIDALYADIEKHEVRIEAQGSLIEKQAEEINVLKVERRKNEKRIARVERWARRLRDQVIELGGTPVSIDDLE